jgi:hypothetical protein
MFSAARDITSEREFAARTIGFATIAKDAITTKCALPSMTINHGNVAR